MRVVAADGALAGERLRPASADPWSATCPTACSTPAGAPAAASAVRRQVLEAALPAWLRVLRPGSGAWLAWNARILPRRRLVELMRAAGLETLEGPPCDGCAHRVDQAIQRDVLVASRP